ncbi:MAG: hypothetical protein MRY79_04040 [Alphaproteobacteria bacterium]|nr:hypothetical protein [Alphaproteobacteria bacterium]
MNVSQTDLFDKSTPLDAIEQAVSPLDVIGGSITIIRGGAVLTGQYIVGNGGKLV